MLNKLYYLFMFWLLLSLALILGLGITGLLQEQQALWLLVFNTGLTVMVVAVFLSAMFREESVTRPLEASCRYRQANKGRS